MLIDLLLEMGLEPSMVIGDFCHNATAIAGWRKRFEFFNHSQKQVVREIAATLPRIPRSNSKDALQAMHDSHLANIAFARNCSNE